MNAGRSRLTQLTWMGPIVQRYFTCFCLVLLTHAGYCSAEFDLSLEEDVVTVLLDGQLLTRYVPNSGSKPILWPLMGPSGDAMTRGFPMQTAEDNGTTDHVHHRSLWFGHGDVNGVDFWSEERGAGSIVHQEYVKLVPGSEPMIVTRNDWLDADGQKVCSDLRAIRFVATEQHRMIDFDITILAGDEPVTFGDTKEGCFAIRVADPIAVDSEQGGAIINSLEVKDKEAWGKAAAWVDFNGPVGETKQRAGIAVLNHPHSFRFPTYWHVRTYGLFAANVFGLHNFRNLHDEDGSFELEAGGSFSLHYRVVLHLGDPNDARIPEAFVEYAKTNKLPVTDVIDSEIADADGIPVKDVVPDSDGEPQDVQTDVVADPPIGSQP